MMIPGFKCSACSRGVFTNGTIVTCSSGHVGMLVVGYPTVAEEEIEESPAAPSAGRPPAPRPVGKVAQAPAQLARPRMFEDDDE